MENKVITFDNKKTKQENKSVKTEKPKKVRILVESLVLQDIDYTPEKQWNLLCENPKDSSTWKTMKQHIQMKIQGYKNQDQKNEIYAEMEFIDIENVLNLLRDSNMHCYYCKEWVQLLYRHVREPKQWTLERINNDIGHNRGNVVIACLNCNLRRRCMYHERFLFTKQLKIIKKEESKESI